MEFPNEGRVGSAANEVIDGETLPDAEALLPLPLLLLLLGAIDSDANSCMILGLVECHLTWMTSAQTVLLAMSALLTVDRGCLVGRGPAASVDVDQTLVKSLLIRLAQAFRRIPTLVVWRK